MRIIPLPQPASRHGDIVHRLWFTPGSRHIVVLLGHEEVATALCWVNRAEATLTEELCITADDRDGALPAPEFSADHRYLAIPAEDGEMVVLDRSGAEPVRVVLEGPSGAGPYEQYGCAAFSPDGALLVASRSVGTLPGVWPIHRWASAGALQAGEERASPVPGTEIRCRHDCGPAGLAIAPNGSYLASMTHDGRQVFIWKFVSGELLAELELAGTGRRVTAYARHVLFSPDGRTLAVAGSELVLFDVGSWEVRHLLETDSEVCAVAFQPDGRRLATVDDAEEVILWDVATGDSDSLLSTGAGTLRTVAIAPDGAIAAGGTEEGRLVLWE